MPSSLLKLKSFAKPILRDEVYLAIKEAILTGEMTPGERLSIGRLLQEIGFSPTPIREALLKLEQEGFVSRLQRGRALNKPERICWNSIFHPPP
jgi:DNA-binding GntR family transcriptional regulator